MFELQLKSEQLSSSNYSLALVDTSTTLQRYPYAPWCWNIYLQNWAMFGVSRDSYSSTMARIEHIELVGGLKHVFPHIRNFIIPIDERIFVRGVGSTTNQLWYIHILIDYYVPSSTIINYH